MILPLNSKSSETKKEQNRERTVGHTMGQNVRICESW